jgi:hypothetical protein
MKRLHKLLFFFLLFLANPSNMSLLSEVLVDVEASAAIGVADTQNASKTINASATPAIQAALIEKQNLETAFMKTFSDPEEFKASGIFQLLGYNSVEIAQIGKITPRPAEIKVETELSTTPGSYRNLKVLCSKVCYYNLTIERVLFDFPECSIDTAELQAGRLRFLSGEQISLKTEVSADDILRVFNLYAQARSLSQMSMTLEKGRALLKGRIKKGIVTAAFNLRGRTELVDPKTVMFRCERLHLNGYPLPRNVIASIFKQINPVFDSNKTWLNLNVASISIKPGFVVTHATIDRKKG